MSRELHKSKGFGQFRKEVVKTSRLSPILPRDICVWFSRQLPAGCLLREVLCPLACRLGFVVSVSISGIGTRKQRPLLKPSILLPPLPRRLRQQLLQTRLNSELLNPASRNARSSRFLPVQHLVSVCPKLLRFAKPVGSFVRFLPFWVVLRHL